MIIETHQIERGVNLEQVDPLANVVDQPILFVLGQYAKDGAVEIDQLKRIVLRFTE